MPRLLFGLALASLSLMGCSGRTTAANGEPDDASSPEDASVDVVTDAGGSDGPLVIDPDQGMTWLYDFIGTAKSSIDMTMYELTDTKIVSLLTQAAQSGITVRVILDQNLEQKDNTSAYNALVAGGVKVHWANPIYASTHQKTLTVDQTTSAIMTMNLESDDYATSRDFAVITADAADVAAIETVFGADFQNGPITPPNGDNLVWSPTNSENAIIVLIQGAKSSLYVENEEMGNQDVVSALSAAASHGVAVNVTMENSRTYTTEFEALQDAGVTLSMYLHASLYIHAKAILSDYGSSNAKAFIGSENFTTASLTENRELGLITTDPAILEPLHATLQSDIDGGTPFHPLDGGASGGHPADAGSD